MARRLNHDEVVCQEESVKRWESYTGQEMQDNQIVESQAPNWDECDQEKVD